jgi:hypothetical protein
MDLLGICGGLNMTTTAPFGKTCAPFYINPDNRRRKRLAEWDEIQSYHWLRASISPYYLLGMALFGADKNDLGEADYESYFAEQGWKINDIISWKPHKEA